MRRTHVSGRWMRTRPALSLAGAVVLSAVAVVVTPTTASASGNWCGNWLKNPAGAHSVKMVPGTRAYAGGGHFQVEQGSYRGQRYAWAYESKAGAGPALNWRYTKNKGLYTCYPRTEGGTYTPGVPDYQVYKVQAELETYPNKHYGPAVFWGG